MSVVVYCKAEVGKLSEVLFKLIIEGLFEALINFDCSYNNYHFDNISPKS